MSTIRLKKWNPRLIGDDKTILVIGKRGSGKSTAISDILYSKRDRIPAAMVISGTEESNGHYSKYVPPIFVHSEYRTEILERVFQRQKDAIRKNSVSPTLLVLDDCLYDKAFLKDVAFRNLMLNGRHYKLFTVISTQYALDIPPYARANFDYVICFRDPIKSNRERLYKQFFGIFDAYKDFASVYDACSENFECIVLDQTSRSNKVSDSVFWWKASIRPQFRFGSNAYWATGMSLMRRGLRKPPTDKTDKPPEKKTIIKKLL